MVAPERNPRARTRTWRNVFQSLEWTLFSGPRQREIQHLQNLKIANFDRLPLLVRFLHTLEVLSQALGALETLGISRPKFSMMPLIEKRKPRLHSNQFRAAAPLREGRGIPPLHALQGQQDLLHHSLSLLGGQAEQGRGSHRLHFHHRSCQRFEKLGARQTFHGVSVQLRCTRAARQGFGERKVENHKLVNQKEGRQP